MNRILLLLILAADTVSAFVAATFLVGVFPNRPVLVSLPIFILWLVFGYLAVYDYLRFDHSEERAHRALARNLRGER